MNTATQISWTIWSLNRFSLTLSISAYLTWLLFGGVDFQLVESQHFFIGQASQQGVDVSARVSTYFKVILFVAFSFAFTYRLLFNWPRKSESKFQNQVIRPAAIACTGLVLANVMGVENSNLVHHFFYLLFTFLTLEVIPPNVKATRLLKSTTVLLWAISIAILETFLLLILFNSIETVWSQGFTLFYLLFVLNLGLVVICFKRGLSVRKLMNWTTPLSLIPILVLFFVELNIWYFNRFGGFLPYKWLLLGTLIVLALSWLVRLHRTNDLKSGKSLMNNVLFPSVLVGMVMFSFYEPFQVPTAEMFETANPANAQMRFWWFGEWPFLDFMSSHLLSEQWFGYIFHQIHGFDGSLSFMSFDFLNLILVFLLGYWFLKRTLQNGYSAFLFLLLFPFPFVFLCRPLALVLLLLLFIDKCRSKPKWYFCLYAVGFSLLSLFWRLDVGVSVLYALLVFLPIILLKERNRQLTKNVLKSFVICAIAALVIVLIFGVIFSFTYLKMNFLDALNYVTGSQAHGYAVIADTKSNGFFMMYVLMPILAVMGVLIGMRQYFMSQVGWTDRYAPGLASIFLLLIYLVNMPRGLVRHGLAEGHDSFLTATFFIGISLLVWASIKGRSKLNAFETLFSVGLLSIILFKVYPWPSNHQLAERTLSGMALANLDLEFDPSNEHQRFQVNSSVQSFSELQQFFEKELWPNQTFFDFSNSPMLYYHLKRPVPSFFCQPLQNTVTDWQQLNQLKKWNSTLIPAVIYGNYPRTWFDATDGIPNNLRQYLLAEKIYKDYQPHGVMNGKSLWLSKQIDLTNESVETDSNVFRPETHNYGQMAVLWAKHLASDIEKGRDLLIESQLKFEVVKKGVYRVYLPDQKNEKVPCFVRLKINDETDETSIAKAQIYQENKLIGVNNFVVEYHEQDYLIRLSNHYLYHIHGASHFDLRLNERGTLKNVELIVDRRHENR